MTCTYVSNLTVDNNYDLQKKPTCSVGYCHRDDVKATVAKFELNTRSRAETV